MQLTFVEHENFARESRGILSENDIIGLMLQLLEHPDAGDIIPRSGGL